MLATSLPWTFAQHDLCFRSMVAQAAAAQSPPQTPGGRPWRRVRGPAAEVADTAVDKAANRRQT